MLPFPFAEASSRCLARGGEQQRGLEALQANVAPFPCRREALGGAV